MKKKKPTKEQDLENLKHFLNRCAKKLRNKRTVWEGILYKYLKELGYKFKFQVPIICKNKYGYIVDFLLTDYNIFIEADGKQHYTKENIKKDNQRSRRLKKEGYYPLRLANSQISTLTKDQIKDIIELSIAIHSVKI